MASFADLRKRLEPDPATSLRLYAAELSDLAERTHNETLRWHLIGVIRHTLGLIHAIEVHQGSVAETDGEAFEFLPRRAPPPSSRLRRNA
jgi:hypothetical protein